MVIISVNDFLNRAEAIPVVDVRTPAEFYKGHIPGAVNIPLFTDLQRADVGTIYKQKGELEAVLKGLDYVGPEMSALLRRAITVAGKGKSLAVYCWRGGKRSASMSWLFEQGGLKCEVVEGGYKNYRNYILDCLDKPRNIVVLGGMTGSGKTEILKQVSSRGEQVIDLEAIANHRGSAFGAIGMPPQPSTEHFANLLFNEVRKTDPVRRLFLEDESLNIGSVFMPEKFYQRIRESRVIALMSGIDIRMPRLEEEYGKMPLTELENSINRIRKRLGGKNADEALASLKSGDIRRAIEIVLEYYDKTYGYGLGKRDPSTVTLIDTDTHDASINAEKVIKQANILGL